MASLAPLNAGSWEPSAARAFSTWPRRAARRHGHRHPRRARHRRRGRRPYLPLCTCAPPWHPPSTLCFPLDTTRSGSSQFGGARRRLRPPPPRWRPLRGFSARSPPPPPPRGHPPPHRVCFEVGALDLDAHARVRTGRRLRHLPPRSRRPRPRCDWARPPAPLSPPPRPPVRSTYCGAADLDA